MLYRKSGGKIVYLNSPLERGVVFLETPFHIVGGTNFRLSFSRLHAVGIHFSVTGTRSQ